MPRTIMLAGGTASVGVFSCRTDTTPPTVTTIALPGDTAPGLGTPFSTDISDPSLSDDGRVAFIEPGSVGPSGTWVSAPLLQRFAVPTMGPAALALLSGLLALTGLWAFRRFGG